jgi:hypothetical protein
MKSFLISAIAAGVLGLSLSPASACDAATLGRTWCKGGVLYLCTRCGDQYCDIMNNPYTRCLKDDHPDLYTDNASRFPPLTSVR